MENEATTKTPIPARSGFRNFAFCTLHFDFPTANLPIQSIQPQAPPDLLYPFIPSCPSCPLCSCVLLPFVPLCLRGYKSITQNKHNFKMGKMTISTASLKAYTNKQRTMNTKRYPKQSQSNPIPPPPGSVRQTISLGSATRPGGLRLRASACHAAVLRF